MKSQPCMVTITVLVSVAACNYTQGDCYPRGQGGGTVDVGSGVPDPTGPGNPGDEPQDQPSGGMSESACNAPEQSSSGGGSGTSEKGDMSGEGGADALDDWINCKGLDALGCMMKCNRAGAVCTQAEKHPYKPDVGYGDLYMCKNGWPTSTCSYYYSNGDECVFFFMAPFARVPLCVYIGGKH